MEPKLNGNKIQLPIGTEISFTSNADRKRKVLNNENIKLIDSEQSMKFYALFDENDVDFEIVIDNTKCHYGIGYTLMINEGYYDYYVGPRESWIMEALYSKGRKLHFISQSTDEGKLIVAETADKHNLSYAEASAVCSRIEFNFEVEKSTKMERFDNWSGDDVPDSLQSPITLFNAPTSMSLMSNTATISTLSNQRQSQLTEMDCAQTLGVKSFSSHSMAPKAKKKSALVFGSQSRTLSSKPLYEESRRAIPLVANETDERETITLGDSEPQPGDRGVICFGEQSTQVYNAYSGFAKDADLAIKPFIVEMRMSSTVTPI